MGLLNDQPFTRIEWIAIQFLCINQPGIKAAPLAELPAEVSRSVEFPIINDHDSLALVDRAQWNVVSIVLMDLSIRDLPPASFNNFLSRVFQPWKELISVCLSIRCIMLWP